jgi:hypothetical protein
MRSRANRFKYRSVKATLKPLVRPKALASCRGGSEPRVTSAGEPSESAVSSPGPFPVLLPVPAEVAAVGVERLRDPAGHVPV